METYEANDYKTAFKLFHSLAKKGNTQAQNKLAFMYERELGTDRNIDKAAAWYLKAATQGDVESQVKVAGFYLQGISLKKDIWEAMKWLRKAAIQDNPEAEANIAYMFHDGIGVEQDYIEAAKWYRKAAEQGLPSAQHDLGVMYQNGRGLEKDDEAAIKWYRKASNQGFSRSQDNLYRMYKKRLFEDNNEKFRWFLKLAQIGDITAQYFVGNWYYLGKGIPKNDIKAFAWTGIAAAGGFNMARSLRNKIESNFEQNRLHAARGYARELWEKYGNKPR